MQRPGPGWRGGASQPPRSPAEPGDEEREKTVQEARRMKRVMLITSHYLESQRKAGFHFLADAFWRAGWDVTFTTVSLSWLSWLRKDQRFQYPVRQEAKRLRQIKERLASYV